MLCVIVSVRFRSERSLPSALDVSEVVLRATLNDKFPEEGGDKPQWWRDEDSRMQHSMAIIRYM